MENGRSLINIRNNWLKMKWNNLPDLKIFIRRRLNLGFDYILYNLTQNYKIDNMIHYVYTCLKTTSNNKSNTK